jgi:hypothetical protein
VLVVQLQQKSGDRGATASRCVLVVEFRLRAVRGRGHVLFRWESLLNTPLFAGFPGLVSKLWLAADERGRYRGLYEWEGPRRAEAYARALWRVLALVSVPGSIHYVVLPGLRRDELLRGRRSWPMWRMRRPGGAWPRSHDRPSPILVAGAGRVGLALALARQGNPSLVLMTVVKAGGPTQGPHPRACQGPWQMSRFN